LDSARALHDVQEGWSRGERSIPRVRAGKSETVV
jgi:hypothetical protein